MNNNFAFILEFIMIYILIIIVLNIKYLISY